VHIPGFLVPGRQACSAPPHFIVIFLGLALPPTLLLGICVLLLFLLVRYLFRLLVIWLILQE
jgi:hypothetical protein